MENHQAEAGLARRSSFGELEIAAMERTECVGEGWGIRLPGQRGPTERAHRGLERNVDVIPETGTWRRFSLK